MSEFIEILKELYEKKKDMERPPGYLKTVKDILDTNNLLNKTSDSQKPG